MPIRPSKEKAAQFAVTMVPDMTEVFVEFQRQGKALRLPQYLVTAKERLKAEQYVRLYENESWIHNALALGVLGYDELKLVSAELETLSDTEQAMLLDQLVTDLESDLIDDAIDELENQNPDEAVKAFEALSEEEKKKTIVQAHFIVMFLHAGFYNYVAVMVHGNKMTELVPAAIAGDRTAFLKAVQIDKSLLVNHSYFREARQRAIEAREEDFLRQILYWETKPVLAGRIRYPGLWMMFSVLDSLKYLDGTFSHEELLDLCDKAGLDRFQNRIEDVNYLTKRLSAFRKAQKLRGLSMP